MRRTKVTIIAGHISILEEEFNTTTKDIRKNIPEIIKYFIDFIK
jgi:hypothetical protein